MSPRPSIFISAVSRELGGARQLVANTLTFLGYSPVWQDIFATEGGDLREMLRTKVDYCQGVVQLVGSCYGAEPPTPDEKFGRVSYTQYEALYARARNKKVWYLFIDETFPIDPHEPEPRELTELQQSYRRTVQADTHIFHALTSREGLEAGVLKLRDDLTSLRRGMKQWAAAVAALLVLIAALVLWLLRGQHAATREVSETKREVAETRNVVAAMTEEMAALRKSLVQYAKVETKVRQAQSEEDPAVIEERIYAALSKETGLDVQTLREKLPGLAEKLKGSSDATTFERANAAYVRKDYPEAERLALQAVKKDQGGADDATGSPVEALTLAALAAEKAIQYDRAMQHLREAERMTDRGMRPAEWADVQHLIADVLIDQGKYAEAETTLRPVVDVRTEALGPEHADTLRGRGNFARALLLAGKFSDAEKEYRDVATLQSKVMGVENPDTLATLTGLATTLFREAKYAESEKELRAVLATSEKVLGPDHPDTLRSRNYLAGTLSGAGKFAEAEAQSRMVLAGRIKALGPENPETIAARNNLAGMLLKAEKFSEAEKEFRDLIPLSDKVLGPEHPQGLTLRVNLTGALLHQKKFEEAEPLARDLVTRSEKALGPEHPNTLASRAELAHTLMTLNKFGEAEPAFRKLIAQQEKVLGPNHPNTLAACADLAYVLARSNRKAEAITLARRAVEGARQTLGADHPMTKVFADLLQNLEGGRH
jgi:tetratricopeptide (TPR) repeat protein